MAVRFRPRLRVVPGSGLSYRPPTQPAPTIPPPDNLVPLSVEAAGNRLLFRIGIGATIAAGAVYLTQ
jgi:hypothetical protein